MSQPHSFLPRGFPSSTEGSPPQTGANMDLSHSHAHPNETRPGNQTSTRSTSNPVNSRSRYRPHMRPRTPAIRSHDYNTRPGRQIVQASSQWQPVGPQTVQPRQENLTDVTRTPSTSHTDDDRRNAQQHLRTQPLAPGTREDVEDPSYQSPVSVVFNSGWRVYDTAEETGPRAESTGYISGLPLHQQNQPRERQERLSTSELIQHLLLARVRNRSPPERTNVETLHPALTSRLSANPIAHLDGHMDPSTTTSTATPTPSNYTPLRDDPSDNALYLNAHQRRALQFQARTRAEADEMARNLPPSPTFDTQIRPPPRSSDDMTLDMACKICRDQTIDTVLLPCMHACMCHWCADLQVPLMPEMKNIPRYPETQCPICRRVVEERRGVFI